MRQKDISDLSKKIKDVVLKDLGDRRGFRHLLESIKIEDPETFQELQNELVAAIETTLENYLQEKENN